MWATGREVMVDNRSTNSRYVCAPGLVVLRLLLVLPEVQRPSVPVPLVSAPKPPGAFFRSLSASASFWILTSSLDSWVPNRRPLGHWRQPNSGPRRSCDQNPRPAGAPWSPVARTRSATGGHRIGIFCRCGPVTLCRKSTRRMVGLRHSRRKIPGAIVQTGGPLVPRELVIPWVITPAYARFRRSR